MYELLILHEQWIERANETMIPFDAIVMAWLSWRTGSICINCMIMRKSGICIKSDVFNYALHMLDLYDNV